MSSLQNMDNVINHTGTVVKIEDHSVFVRITQKAACAGCHAKAMCMASESKEKLIEIPDHSGKYRVHEEVLITGKNSMGFQAVSIAFVLPLILVVAIIAYGNHLEWEESTVALSGLGILLPYYITLYFLRDKLKRKFIFTLKKLNE